jgi:hypothetical protein
MKSIIYIYLFISIFSEELGNSNLDSDISMTSSNLSHFHFDMLTRTCPMTDITQKTLKNKPKKRLNSK